MGGEHEVSGDGTKGSDPSGPPPEEGRSLDRGNEPGEADRSPDEQAEMDRKVGDVADDLADFA